MVIIGVDSTASPTKDGNPINKVTRNADFISLSIDTVSSLTLEAAITGTILIDNAVVNTGGS